MSCNASLPTSKQRTKPTLKEYIYESNIEDFIAADKQSVLVSTIHKAKGREADTVYLIAPIPDEKDVDKMRAYYVGLTRAKRKLFIVPDTSTPSADISIALNMHDVLLDFFKTGISPDRQVKRLVLRLRSGDRLIYDEGHLLNSEGEMVAALSASGRAKLKKWTDKGYEVIGAEVSYILAWKPKNENAEYAVCLANIFLRLRS